MVSINQLSYFIGDRPLYENASLHIKPKDRIGLVGLNGTGKSTLLKLIIGEITPDSGEIAMQKDCKIGYLNQDLLSDARDDKIINITIEGFQRELQLKNQIDKLLQQIELNCTEELLNKLSAKQEEFEVLGGYSIQSKAEEILEGLGFKTEELENKLSTFSGGWRMRVMLARLLLSKPGLLLLDEPTNHLDLPTIMWLENYIARYDGAVVIVSHDKTFLNRAVSSIVEVSQKKLSQYAGNYDFYLEEKTLRAEIHENAFKNQQQKIKQTEQFISRFRAKASKARQVQSKVKMLDKMDKIELEGEEVSDMNLRFSVDKASGKIVANLNDITKSYGTKEVIIPSSLSINRGDKIALVGANGKGKSTLLKLIARKEAPSSGEINIGHNVIDSFYAQHQLEDLSPNNEILEELKQSGSNLTELEIRKVLGCFLFEGDSVFKKVKVLSGGERSRVALAKTLISMANFLILDEPTHHLDINSIHILKEALIAYEGTYLVVSHDRDFISQIATKIWYIEDKVAKEYPGNYLEFQDFLKKREEQAKEEEEFAKGKKQAKPSKSSTKPKKQNNNSANLQKEITELEQSIENLEKQKNELEANLADVKTYSNPDFLEEKNNQFQKVSKELNQLTQKWENLIAELD